MGEYVKKGEVIVKLSDAQTEADFYKLRQIINLQLQIIIQQEIIIKNLRHFMINN